MFRARSRHRLIFVAFSTLIFAATAHAELRRGMTWTVREQQGSYVHVGSDGVTDAYNGDTTIDQYRPLLCLQVDGQPAPPISFDFYNGWVGGNLAVTGPIQGAQLTSQARGDEICAQILGAGYRMAEFHDGSGGWSYWGAGSIAPGTRFWTAINDQPANPWNSSGDPLELADDIDKPLSTSCGGVSSERVAPLPLEVELDQPFDITIPFLGFVPPPPEEESIEKASGETCQVDDPGTPEEPYEKTDATGGVLFPCAIPMSLTVTAGVRDNYAQPAEPANRTQLITQGITALGWADFDSTSANLFFGHEFQLAFVRPAFYRSGSLTLYIRAIQGRPDNDTISLGAGPANIPGWGANLTDPVVRYRPVAGEETTVVLDLATLTTGGGKNLLAEIGTYGNLKVLLQDDTAVDSMTLKLACDESAAPEPLVGVVLGSGDGCAPYPEYRVHLDNEDHKNANGRGGWIGTTISDKNTTFRLCAVDGLLFTPAATAGARFAVVALASSCPDGLTRFDRYHDNEDNRPASSDNAPSNSATYTVGSAKNTNMAFCVATGLNKFASNSVFPSLGISYGVFGGKNLLVSRWATARGWLFLDDEDHNNQNKPASPPSYTFDFLEAGKNTKYYLGRVR